MVQVVIEKICNLEWHTQFENKRIKIYLVNKTHSDHEATETRECELWYVAHSAHTHSTCEDHTRASKGNGEII